MPATNLSVNVHQQLHAIAHPVRKPRGALLIRAGEAGRGAFLTKSGVVKMTLGANPKLYPSRRLGAGKVLGLPATFSGEPYSLTAECATNCCLDFIPRENLLNLLQTDPGVGFQIVRILSEEIFQMRKSIRGVPNTRSRKPRRRS
jgi:CRP-like cAMP-binding protein